MKYFERIALLQVPIVRIRIYSKKEEMPTRITRTARQTNKPSKRATNPLPNLVNSMKALIQRRAATSQVLPYQTCEKLTLFKLPSVYLLYVIRLRRIESESVKQVWTDIQRLFNTRTSYQERKLKRCAEQRRVFHDRNLKILEKAQQVFEKIRDSQELSQEFIDEMVKTLVNVDEGRENPGLLTIQLEKIRICQGFLALNLEASFNQEQNSLEETLNVQTESQREENPNEEHPQTEERSAEVNSPMEAINFKWDDDIPFL